MQKLKRLEWPETKLLFTCKLHTIQTSVCWHNRLWVGPNICLKWLACNDWLNAECHARDTAVEKLWLDITNMLWNHRKSLQRPTIIFNSIWLIHKKKKRSFKSVRVVLVRYMWIQRSKWKPWAVSRRSNLRESIQVIGCNTIALQSAEVRKCIDSSSGKQLETFLYYQKIILIYTSLLIIKSKDSSGIYKKVFFEMHVWSFLACEKLNFV